MDLLTHTGCDFLHERITYQISNIIQVKFIGIIEVLENINWICGDFFPNDGRVDG